MNSLVLKLGSRVRSEFRKRTRTPVESALKEIRQVQDLSERTATTFRKDRLVTEGLCILIPTSRKDGVGIQSMARICVMQLARQVDATYVHLPFLKLAHQEIDPEGQQLSPVDWAARWEGFLNLGLGEWGLNDLAQVLGPKALARQLSNPATCFNDPDDEARHRLPGLIEQIRRQGTDARQVWTFGLGLCRQPRECQLFLDGPFIRSLQQKFNQNGYQPEESLYDDQYLNVVLHIRRGDVWNAVAAGSTNRKYTNKLPSQEYYVELLQRLDTLFAVSFRPVRFHVFSDGKPQDFGLFTFTDERNAFLPLANGTRVDNIRFHLCSSTLDTLYHMIKAPILVPGKSTFSVLALVLGNPYVLHERAVTEFYQYDLLERYMKENSRFIPLLDLAEDRVAEILVSLAQQARFPLPVQRVHP